MIEKIEALALAAARGNRLDTHTPAVILGDGIESLEYLQAGRSRFRGRFETSALSEFAFYVKANPGGHGFIDAGALSAKVIHNLGTPGDPGHADWLSRLTLDPTAAYAAMTEVEGQPLTQKRLVEWIEDWTPHLGARYGAEAEETGIAKALASIRNLTLSAKSDVTHTDRDFGASRSALEEIEAKAQGGLPSHLVFTCEPYLGFQTRDFALRLSVNAGDTPTLKLRIVGRESLKEAIAQEFKARLIEEIGDAASMAIGKFTP